jgi:hypothetical protein
MKRFKNIASKLGILVFGCSYIILVCLAMSSAKTKTELINFEKDEDIDNNIIVVHFIHGSIPKEDCSYQKKRLGGYLGGHIEIEVNNFVYGFLYDTLPMNYIPKSTFNSKFEKRGFEVWNELIANDKITSIEIPTDKKQTKELEILLNKYWNKAPYDYSFLGQRCASSTAKILSDIGIINKFSNQESIIAFYYPKLLRRTMIKYAEKNNYKIKNKSGIDCHNWE